MVDSSVLKLRFGDRARVLMARAGLQKSDLVDITGLGAAKIDRILSDTNSAVTINDMEKIANALEVSLYSLLAP